MPALDIIPQLYYDILGRIIPGAVAIWLWVLAANGQLAALLLHPYSGSQTLSGSLLVLLATWSIAAYVIGHLLSPISAMIHTRILARYLPSYFNILQDAVSVSAKGYPPSIRSFFADEAANLYGKDTVSRGVPSAAQYRQATYIWYDLVRLRSVSSGSRLGKMRAEYRMLEGLYVAFALTVPIQVCWWLIVGGDFSLELLAASLCGFILSCWSAVRLFQTFQRAVINEYYLTSVQTKSATTDSKPTDGTHPQASQKPGQTSPASIKGLSCGPNDIPCNMFARAGVVLRPLR